jgi:hypothetical protein
MVKTFIGVLFIIFSIHYFTVPLYGMVNYIGLIYMNRVAVPKNGVVAIADGVYSNQDHAELKPNQPPMQFFAFHGISQKPYNICFFFKKINKCFF